MCEGFSAIGVEAHVIASSVEPGHSDDSVHTVQIARAPAPVRAVRRAMEKLSPGWRRNVEVGGAIAERYRELARTRGATLLEMEESFGIAAAVRARTGLPVIVRLHGPWFLNGAWHTLSKADRLRIARERAGIAAATGVTAPSRDVLERTKAHYGLDLPGAAVIPYPIPLAPPSERWRPDPGRPETVLFVGRFDNHKGGDVMLDAFARVAATRPGTRLIFVGPQPGYVDPAGRRWSYEDYARRCFGDRDIAARVQATGPLAPPQVRGLRREASVVVAPSRYENFGFTILECLSQGCPVVATSAGGTPEIVQHDRNGLLAPPGEPGPLAEAIVALLADPARAERLAAQGLADCAERYHPETIARTTAAFYTRVLGGPGSVRR
jgi:glycosyltransferase involved in cell wall biosynthesis